LSRNIVAILRGVRPSEAVAVTAALIEAGITRIEVPLNSPDPFESISRMVKEFGSAALIGAGTVLTVKDVTDVKAAGAGLVVSPDCNTEVIAATKAAGMISIPGVMTPTECFAALRTGADAVKLFPGALIGPSGLKAMRAVLPEGAEVLAVGGAGPESFAEWKTAGADGFGIGTALYSPGDAPVTVGKRACLIVERFDAVFRV
jgi:2-dehydro-3-deoxyphosphogalactonate aldolase